jgi:hypothetical protein
MKSRRRPTCYVISSATIQPATSRHLPSRAVRAQEHIRLEHSTSCQSARSAEMPMPYHRLAHSHDPMSATHLQTKSLKLIPLTREKSVRGSRRWPLPRRRSYQPTGWRGCTPRLCLIRGRRVSPWCIGTVTSSSEEVASRGLRLRQSWSRLAMVLFPIIRARDRLPKQYRHWSLSLSAANRFTLQSTPSLTPPVTWLDVTNPPTLLGGLFTVTNPMSGPAQFFRLAKP